MPLRILIRLRSGFIASLVLQLLQYILPVKIFLLQYIFGCTSILQIVIWLVIPATKKDRADQANNTLALIVLIQYVPRLFLIFPLNRRIIKTTGVVAKTAWAGAAYNLLLYMLASHVSILSANKPLLYCFILFIWVKLIETS